MKILLSYIAATVLTISVSAQSYPKVVIETNLGTIKLRLYEDTPIHSENFIELINKGFYNDQIFHRVISSFMIQAGDPDSKNAKPGQRLGSGGVSYTLPAEFRPAYYHKKGALAAARLGDNINPNKESSGCQFYIVQGKVFSKEYLLAAEKNGHHMKFTEDQLNTYSTIGGTPHLDYGYTVFGEVISGLEIVDKIASVPVDNISRPIEDIKIKIYTEK